MHARSLLVAGLTLILASAATAGGGKPVKRQYVNFTGFHVSFNAPSSSSGQDPPREVELHVSSDEGATWELAGKAKPSEQKILFRAPRDGEYWFMPRTKYASGRYLPQGRPAAEMKVVVDTVTPVVELDAQNDDGGEIIIRWHIADSHLKRDSFKLEYKAATADGKWQPISIDPGETSSPSGDIRGETPVVLPIREQSVEIIVRAEAADEAGNRTVKERRLPPAPSSVAGEHDPAQLADQDPPAMLPSYPETATPDWPAEESAIFGETGGARPARDPGDSVRARSASVVRRLRDLPYAGAQGGPQAGEEPEETMPPPGVHPQLINKRQFELFYDVDAIGSDGIVQVELWITADGGRTWASYGLDEDCRSPMVVKVDEEGLYGFRVVVETASGLRGPSPDRGDLPDMWVGVDFTRPEAGLISAGQGEGEEADRLVITWQASDDHLASRGISLRWAESSSGPWNTIASGLENSGRYAWRLDKRVPPRVYILLEARDEAGNVAADRLAEPVALERIRPQGHIREVRPLDAAP
ncbi:MAG TPA: hypothetical protein VG826_09590 [Pirellulales bacterium]|nr:hypothetical protein [Pirellulales bacterium]